MRIFKRITVSVLALSVILQSAFAALAAGQTLAEQLSSDRDYGVSFEYTESDDFSDVRAEYEQNGYAPAQLGAPIALSAGDFTASGSPITVLSEYEGRSQVFLWEEKNAFVEWQVTVPVDGIYAFRMEYMAADAKISPITRSLLIDGAAFYSEAENLSFYRLFRDDGEPIVNSVGDEIAPDVAQYYAWQWQSFADTDASYDGELQFYLTAGLHTLRMELISGAMYLAGIELYAAAELPSYAEVSAGYQAAGYTAASNSVRFEAEGDAILFKNSSTLRAVADGDPGCTPFAYGRSRINAFGDTLWQSANSAVTYQFTVEQSGLYALSMRVKMNYRDGIPSYRSIAIDGEIPFREFQAYCFTYEKSWRTEVLSDGDGKPYYVYLEAGTHTLTMAVKQGELSPITDRMQTDSDLMSELLLKIKMIIGQNPDTNYDYELDRQIPDLIPTLETIISDMRWCMDAVEQVAGRKQSKYYQMKSFITQLQELIDNPFVIPGRITSVEEIITSYGSWLSEMQMHPLMLDFIEVLGNPEQKTVSESNFFQRLYGSAVNFVLSFSKDYNNVSVGNLDQSGVKTTLSLWVSRGTKWCSIMKQLIDSDFTPQTGIAVDLNVLPAGQLNSGSANALLLAITSGRAPDIATGVASTSVGEFAMRNVLVDLTQFEDFAEVRQDFKQELFVPLSYRGGIYSMPETQNFMCMIYRKDIFSRLGLSIPNTWDEVYNKIIPVLNQNNMQFYVPMTDAGYAMFLYQAGGQYYHDDLMTTALDTPQAYQAMVEYTNLYSLYGVPKTASFYNRFRSGEMPVGVVDYTLYMTVKAAASDLAGKWGIALIPGHENADGSIDRSHGTLSAECGMIMKQSKHPQEAWQLLRWWVSEETQAEYANRVESLLGQSARWVTANWNAFVNLSWDADEIGTIERSFDSAKQVPVVLGGYYVSRHITNALNRIIVSGINTRDSLETAVEDINRELQRRRESVS